MKRYFYISNNLDDLEIVKNELEENGLTRPQLHILSQSDADVQSHHLHEVDDILKKDVVHSMEHGALIGIIGSALVLATAYYAGWTTSSAGWLPFIFLAIVILGFCIWEGGLFGIQEPHYQFKRFEDALKSGKHVFFVDVTDQQKAVLAKVAHSHPQLILAGEGESTPAWIVEWQNNWHGFIKTMP